MEDRKRILEAIEAQESLRGKLPDALLDTAISALRQQLEKAGTPLRRRRLVSVLFADIVGSTELGAAMDPEAVGEVFSRLWTEVDTVIRAHHGSIDKHIGDSVMAVWGMGGVREDDPEYAVRAGLEIAETVRRFRAPGIEPGSLSVRVGVNTGSAYLGEIGSSNEYTAIGDTVNTASRIEQSAPEGGLLISHDTYRHVRGIFEVSQQPPLRVKGRNDPLRTYVVTGVAARAFHTPTRGVEGIETRMIGRDLELAQLQDRSRQLEEGLYLVTVIGDAGMGKSRLLLEFEEWLRLQPADWRLFEARGDQQTSGTPLAMIRDLFFNRFQIGETDPPQVSTSKLEKGVAELKGAPDDELAHLIGHLIGVDMASSPHIGAILDEAEQLRDRALQGVSSLLASAAESTLVLLALDDLHWSDLGSLQLLDKVMSDNRGSRILIIAATRPPLFEHMPGWGASLPNSQTLELSALSDDQGRELVDEILHRVRRLPPGLRERIAAQAEGNPYYVEELVKMLIDDGVIMPGSGEWQLAEDALEEIRIPPTLTNVLEARLDRLTDTEREVLQQASVFGRAFWVSPLSEIRNDPITELTPVLESLQEKDLIYRSPNSAFAGSTQYGFTHALLHEVTYGSVLISDRPALHASVAHWLERQPEPETRAEIIASHFDLAGSKTEAANWFLKAGDGARDRFALSEAIDYYRQAIQFDEINDVTRLDAIYGLAEAQMASAEYEEAAATNRMLLDNARESGDLEREAKAQVGLAYVFMRRGSNREMLEASHQALRLLDSAGHSESLEMVDALAAAGWAHLKIGEFDEARDKAEAALAIAQSHSNLRWESRALNLLSLVEQMTAEYDQARVHLKRAVVIDRLRRSPRTEAASLLNIGEILRLQGDSEGAVGHYRQALEIQQSLGDRDQETLTLSNLGGALFDTGDLDSSIDHLSRSLARSDTAGAAEHRSETLRFLAEAMLAEGDTEEARLSALAALAQANQSENPDHKGNAWRVLGNIVSVMGRPVVVDGEAMSAEACFRRSVEIFNAAGMARDQALALSDWSFAAALEDDRGASRLAEEAIAMLRSLDLPLLVDKVMRRSATVRTEREN